MQKKITKFVHENVVVQENIGARFFAFIPYYTEQSRVDEVDSVLEFMNKNNEKNIIKKGKFERVDNNVYVTPDVWQETIKPIYDLLQMPKKHPNELANKTYQNITDIELHETLAIIQMKSEKFDIRVIEDQEYYQLPEKILTSIVDFTKEFARLSCTEGTPFDQDRALEMLEKTKSNYDRFSVTKFFGVNKTLSKMVREAHCNRQPSYGRLQVS